MKPSLRRAATDNNNVLWSGRIFLILAIILVTLLSQWILLEDGTRCQQHRFLSSSSHDDASLGDRRPWRLPLHHRRATTGWASAHCRHLQSLETAPPSIKPKLDLPKQRAFASGGYNAIARGSGEVHLAGPVLNLISRIQHSSTHAIYGTIAELGVHHGRFTGFLFVTARQTEQLVVADLFERLQDLNVDKSGLGDRKRFLQGIQTYGLTEGDLHTVFAGSTDELPFDWSSASGFAPFRLVSVDASHTAELTFNDLQLAFCNLLRGGVVVLDDWFHSIWPGVVEGFYQFVGMGPTPDVYPFLVCESKLYATNDPTYHQLYYRTLLDDPDLSQWITPYAHEKERGKLLYEMNGVNYLKCQSRGNVTVSDIQNVWTKRVY